MPQIRTDDGPRKLRAVWLGPAGSTLPFEWTYVQWSVVLGCIPVGILVAWICFNLLGLDPLVRNVLALVWGAAAGVWIGVKVMKGVTFDEPLRHKRALVKSELDPRTRQPVPHEETWELTMPRVRGEWSPELFDLTEETPQ